MKNVANTLWSFWVWTSSYVLMMVSAGAAILVSPWRPFRKTHHMLGGRGMAECLTLTGSNYRFIYDPAFDPTIRSVFAQNHVSVMDGHIACAVIPHAFCGLHNHWHFRLPGYGWIMKLASGIPVYPRSSGRTAEITEAAKHRVNELGISILVFPEGHRTKDGKVGPFKRGTMFMARDAGIPVVPIAVRGMDKVNRKGSMRIWADQEVVIYIGRQYETTGLATDEDVSAFTDKIRKIIKDFADDGKLPPGVVDPGTHTPNPRNG